MAISPSRPGEALFLGIDLGTGGVRAVAVTESGAVAAAASAAFDPAILAAQPGRHEQPPEAWWQAVCEATLRMLDKLGANDRERLMAVAVDGTSGTLVALDQGGKPVRPALMYNDPRASAEADALNRAAAGFCEKLGYQFNASFALTKIAWLRRHEPAVFDRTARLVHQADAIVEQLTGRPAVTDSSNALKTGYDLIEERWPEWIDEHLGIASRLPPVVPPGVAIGCVSERAARETGLPKGLTVVSGATDGTAAFLASGARRPGDCNTTLGTTLVFKSISSHLCRDRDGLIYCHKLPGGWWLPGAASNTGAEWIGRLFPGADIAALDAAAVFRLPSSCLAYPLARLGERFPFRNPDALGFFHPDNPHPGDRYAACLQGTGLIERLGLEVLDAAAGTSGGEIYSTGGGSRSDVWMQCRANATKRLIHRPSCGESAFGAAILAATGSGRFGLAEAIEQMVRIEHRFEPEPHLTTRYDELFEQFCGELHRRGCLGRSDGSGFRDGMK